MRSWTGIYNVLSRFDADHKCLISYNYRVLSTHSMRIVFVPEKDLDAMHPIEIREPDNEQPN
jgi:hypothetical protein